jgi:hypothetical protein
MISNVRFRILMRLIVAVYKSEIEISKFEIIKGLSDYINPKSNF